MKKNMSKSNKKIFKYKELQISKETWETAMCPMSCNAISNDDMKAIVKSLYHLLVAEFGEDKVIQYIEGSCNDEDYDVINSFRWRTEESLFLEFGAIYFEDID